MSLKRFMVIGDAHGQFVDQQAFDACMRFKSAFKPDIRIHLGDNWDMRNIRRGAEPRDEWDDPQDDFNKGYEFLEKFQPQVFLCGNHEHRLWRLEADPRGLIKHYARRCIGEINTFLAKMKCRLLPYDSRLGVYELGRLKIVHGYLFGLYAVRQHAIIYGGHVLMGHVHTIETMNVPHWKREAVAQSIGCLCDLNQDYMAQRPNKLKWAHGWAYGWINERTGTHQVFQAQKTDDDWILPNGFHEI